MRSSSMACASDTRGVSTLKSCVQTHYLFISRAIPVLTFFIANQQSPPLIVNADLSLAPFAESRIIPQDRILLARVERFLIRVARQYSI